MLLFYLEFIFLAMIKVWEVLHFGAIASIAHLMIHKAIPKTAFTTAFLAALSSSRSLVVGPSEDLCEKVTFRVLNGNLNLPTYLPL